ncbi:MAG: hypothetical protein JRH20_16525 [Deltaproteobacteria bacterium]|nr:hypothetical protein [Deltaproteobacteria bacterium]
MLAQNNTRWRLTITIVVATFCLLGPSRSAAARDLVGARSQGMGGSLRANPIGPTSVYLNPAGMSLAKMYVISTLYQHRGSDGASQLSAAIVDSVTNQYFHAGLFYNFVTASPNFNIAGPGGPMSIERSEQTHETGMATSVALGPWLMLGLTGRYINITTELNEEAPEDMASPDLSAVTLDLGGIIRLGSSFNIAVVGYNLIPVDDAFLAYYPQSLGLGASYSLAGLASLSFDSVLDFSSDPDDKVKVSYHGGAELFLGKRYALRGGAMHDTLRESTYVSGGLALVNRRISLEFGLRQQVDGGSETLLAFSLNLFVQ